jgi:hypothetical protein
MSHYCFVSDCINPVVGGFEEHIDVLDRNNPYHTRPGKKTRWCKRHKIQGRLSVSGRFGRFLTLRELAEE